MLVKKAQQQRILQLAKLFSMAKWTVFIGLLTRSSNSFLCHSYFCDYIVHNIRTIAVYQVDSEPKEDSPRGKIVGFMR